MTIHARECGPGLYFSKVPFGSKTPCFVALRRSRGRTANEGMPLALVEAMWCGRPVVTTDVGGVSEVIKDDITGFVAEAAVATVAESLGGALERMRLQRDRLQEIGKLAAAS